MQATAPTKDETKTEVPNKTSKDGNFIPPHLRQHSKISDNIDELSSKDKITDQDTVDTNAKKEAANGFGQLPATSMKPGILPHLRRMTNVIRDENLHSSHSQSSGKGKDKAESTDGKELWSRTVALAGMKENVKAASNPGAFVRHDPGLEAWLDSQESQSNNASTTQAATFTATDTLIEVDPDSPLKAGEAKIVPVASSTRPTSEKENNARFLKEYSQKLSTLSEKYGKESRQTSNSQEEEGFDPIKFGGANPVSTL